MFQEKEILEYCKCKAPEELKNRIWSSIEQEKRNARIQRQKWVAAAACFVGILFTGSFMYQSSAIMKVNDVPVSYLSVSVEENSGNTPALASEGRNKSIQENIPVELQVSEKAHIKVSIGTLCMEREGNAETKDVMEMEVSKDSVVYWYVETQETNALCTIITEDKEYQYMMEKGDAGWKIRLEKIK